jgi:hypothetical protein
MTHDLKDFQFFSDLQARQFQVLYKQSPCLKKFFFNSLQQITLDTPRLSFEILINKHWPNLQDADKKRDLKLVLQEICDTALHIYLIRNSSYMYI